MATELANVVDFNDEELDHLRQSIIVLKEEIEDSSWNLGMKLFEVHSTSAYMEWGFKNWKDYVEGELHFGLRKANYLVQIAAWFRDLSPSVRGWVEKLGWSKAKELVGVVTNENAAEWKKKVKDKSVNDIHGMLNAERLSQESNDEKVNVNKASDGGEKATRKAFSLFPEQLSNVERAMGKAAEMSLSDKDGHNLDMVCVEFLASHAAIDNVSDYLILVQNVVGLKLIAVKPGNEGVADGEIVFGGSVMDSMIEAMIDEEEDGESEEGESGESEEEEEEVE